LKTLPERPVNSTVVLRRDGTPLQVGNSPSLHFTCGSCARVLARADAPDRLAGLLLVCPACEAINALDAHRLLAPATGPLAAVPPSWSDLLLTGDATLDAQHRRIFERVDALHLAMLRREWAELPPLMDFLGGYVIDHFTMEEAQMQAWGYPSLEAHRTQHAQFIRDYLALKEDLPARGPDAALAARTHAWLVEWLRWHIMGADVALAEFLRRSR